MIRIFPNEAWKEFEVEFKAQKRYAISSYGRLVKFSEKIEDGELLKGTLKGKYKIFSYNIKKDNKEYHKFKYLRKLVAENFLPKKSEEQAYVLYLDYNKNNNFVANLKWATRKEMLEHRRKNPLIIEGIIKFAPGPGKKDSYKLNSAKVKIIKRKLLDPNRKTRMKILAKQYGVSEMQLYRIKSGENWGQVTVD
jgi:hypothetical protein